MDSSRSSLPNVDRANSTLFKRYLDEQHKSVIQSNNNQKTLNPINSTIQMGHAHRQQQDSYTTKFINNNQTSIIKQKYSNGRKPTCDTSKQRSSHTNRFMKRFQRQHKTRETINNVQKRDGRPHFEFHNPSAIEKTIRTDQPINCTCLNLSEQNRVDHHHCFQMKQVQVPDLSLNERYHSFAQHRRQPLHPETVQTFNRVPKRTRSPLPMMPLTTDKTLLHESTEKESLPIEQTLPSASSIEPTTVIYSGIDTTSLFDLSEKHLLDEDWSNVNELLEELSIEMSVPMNADILLEIQESLAERIYDCIVEQVDEFDNDTRSHSTLTSDSSISSTIVPRPSSNNITSHESYDVPPSPIITTAKKQNDNQEKYFQPIHQQPPASFNNHDLHRNRHSTPFNPIPPQIENGARSPFTQSLFEPVNLLRTVAASEKDEFNFLPSSFSFQNHENLNLNLNIFKQQDNSSKSEQLGQLQHHSLPLLNHLLQPRSTPIDNNISAFKPIEPATTRSTTSFALKRPQVINSSMTTNWFGQS